ncbi:serine/threonine-protein kinase [Myxococcus landrumensis]|uniref:non-specific serine/threonine protein kinase n=1 Tax=Myxococcus landrumensis TaxID=2813577 RepID=A0ABX7N2P5_9BACT|nr:serine/threonine-protein kinase [Myxococcus landrumus]QSQ11935.1 protein kinase [Myxococcus landrumus]
MSGTTLPLATDGSKSRSLGKYEVLSRLSTGGMAEIFLASQRGLAGFRKLVVLKQILPDIRGEEEFIRMFLDEAKVTAAFNHPHIAQVFDLDIAEGELFLAMEFVPGATLVEVAKACRQANHPIPMGFSLMSVRDTAVALHYAHTFTDPLGRPSPVIHRDVAEKNIMVTYEGVTKLLDFGIAKNLARASRTAVGMVKGTSGYMSPEQIMGEPLDARSDLFSLGVVLHELLTGMRLFYAKQAEAMMNAVLRCEVTPPSRTNKQIPPELDAIVLRALSKRREDRYSSTLEFARALERAVGPLIWHPEQSSEVMSRLFADRREQTRQLLMAGPANGDATSETSVAAMLANGGLPAPAAPEAPEPPTVNTNTGPPEPRRPSVTVPTVKQPGSTPPATPPPPPRRATTTQPATTPPPPPPPDPEPRKPVLRAPPQKRLASRAPSEPLRLPPPQETPPLSPEAAAMARTQPARPALSTPARTPPPPPPPSAQAARTSGAEDAASRSRSGRSGDALRAVPSSPPPPERKPEVSVARAPALSAEPGGHAGVPARRNAPPAPARRRPQAQLAASFPQQAEAEVEVTTRPARAFQDARRPSSEEEGLEDEDSHVHTQRGVPALGSSKGWRKVLAVVLVLLVAGAAVVGLGLDGGKVSSLLMPAPDSSAAPSKVERIPAPPPKAEVQAAPEPPPQKSKAEEVVPPPRAEPVPVPEEKGAEDSKSPPADEPEDKKRPPLKKPQTGRSRTKEATPKTSRSVPPKTDPADEAKESPPTGGPPGFLSLSTDPYARVFLGGQLLGVTPLFKVSLPSGKHVLKIVGEDGKALKLPVDIKPGETRAVNVPLELLSQQ